jgi:hypothetical protein
MRKIVSLVLLEKDVFVFVGGVVEDDDASLFGQLADSAVAIEEFFRIERFRPDTYEVAGRAIQMNEREAALTGDNGIVPVEEKDFIVGKHGEWVGKVRRAMRIITGGRS